jgi:ABC-type transport system involved in multi-copper enzyme maturation permease subunit
MRPYLAIIRDSFHAAFASRILWIVLIAIVVLLLALAPVGFQETYTVDFSRGDIQSTSRLTGELAKGLKSDKATAAGRIAENLPEELQTQIIAAVEQEERAPSREAYVSAFNELISQEGDWHEDELWKGTLRLRELRELDELDGDSMSDRQRQRRDRLRIEAAIPGAFVARPERSIKLTYAYLETPFDLPFRRAAFEDLLNQIVYPTLLNLLLGVGAVFVGILVTSPIIPDMFQPGSLHLLLSKPISRPSLYLSKFVGGCAFVLLCVSLLVAGLWLISGARLGIWNHRLFLSIPVFVFLFIIYYSVSALAGLHWRSAVVSVAVTVVFWFMCFIVGTTSGIFEGVVADPARAKGIAVSGDSILISNQAGGLKRLNVEGGEAIDIIARSFGPPNDSLGPLTLDDGRVVIARDELGNSTQLVMLDPDENWTETLGREIPSGTYRMISAPDGGVLCLSNLGIYHAAADRLALDPDQDEEPKSLGGFLGGLQKMLGNATNGFQPVLPDGFAIYSPSAISLVAGTNDLVIYGGGQLKRLAKSPDAMKWRIVAETEVGGDNSLQVRMAATPDRILLARKGEPWQVLDGKSLELINEIEVDDTYAAMSMQPTPDGQSAIALMSNKTLMRIDFDEQAHVATDADYPQQGDIESFTWDPQGHLWVAHDIDQLTRIDPKDYSVETTVGPTRDFWRNIYAWVIVPMRMLTPQTGEVGEIVVAAICGRSNIEFAVGEQVERQQLSIVRPLATCGGFAAVMLLLGCIYVYRQDF